MYSLARIPRSILLFVLLPATAVLGLAQSDKQLQREIQRTEERSDYSRTVIISSVQHDGSFVLKLTRFPTAESGPTPLPVELLPAIAPCPMHPLANSPIGWTTGSCAGLPSADGVHGTFSLHLDALRGVLQEEDDTVSLQVFVPEGLALDCPSSFSRSGDNRCSAEFDLADSGMGSFKFHYFYQGVSGTQIIGILGVVFLSGPLLTLWLTWLATRAKTDDKTGISFSFVRILQWTFLIPFIVWLGVAESLNPLRWLSLFGPGWAAFDLNPLRWPSLIVNWAPPLLSWFLCALISHPALKALRRTRMTLRQTVVRSFLFLASTWIPLALFIQGFFQFFVDERWALAWFGAALAMRALAAPAMLRISGMQPEAITQGPLRDRAFALAARMGVKLRNLYFMPTDRMPMANAFTHAARTIYLTDYLLESLDRGEVDAVIAHELGHLKRKHLQKRLAAYLFPLAAMAAVSPYLMQRLRLPESSQTALIIFPPLLALLAFSRRFEYEADREAAAATGQPESVVTALAKITRLNSMPIRWSRWDELLLTHPSTLRRSGAIMQRAGINADRLHVLLSTAAETSARTEHYPLPADVKTRLFSTAFRVRAAQLAGWAAMLASLALPASFALLAARMPMGSAARWIVLAGGFAISLAGYFLVLSYSGCWLVPSLKAKFERRAQDDGFDPKAHSALFVGLAPGDTPLLYEHNMSWDAGFLLLTRDKLVYWGEEARFALDHGQVDCIRLSPDVPNWQAAPRPTIVWRADANAPCQSFVLQPLDIHSLFERRRKMKSVGDLLARWSRGEITGSALPPCCDDLSVPQFRDVTGTSPDQVGTPGRLLRVAVVLLFLAICVSLALGLSYGISDFFDWRYESGDPRALLVSTFDLTAWYATLLPPVLAIFALFPCFLHRRASRKAARAATAGSGAHS